MRSGKTKLVEVLERLVPRPLFVSGITVSFLERAIEAHRPTLLIDEYDALTSNDPALAEAARAQLNRSAKRRGAQRRQECAAARRRLRAAHVLDLGADRDRRHRRTAEHGPRSSRRHRAQAQVVIREGQAVARARRRRSRHPPAQAGALRRRQRSNDCATPTRRRWPSTTTAPRTCGSRCSPSPTLRAGIGRSAPARPGGRWPRSRRRRRPRRTSSSSSSPTFATSSPRSRRRRPPARHAGPRYASARARPDDGPRISSKRLLEKLVGLEERPWSAWGRAKKPITGKALSDLLQPYRVRSSDVRIERTQSTPRRAIICGPSTTYSRAISLLPGFQSVQGPTNPGKQGESEDFANADKPQFVGFGKCRKRQQIRGLSGLCADEKGGVRGSASICPAPTPPEGRPLLSQERVEAAEGAGCEFHLSERGFSWIYAVGVNPNDPNLQLAEDAVSG